MLGLGLGLGLTMRRGGGKPSWLPDNALAAVNYSGASIQRYRASRTFSRASTGTYFDADGVLQTAAIDALRINYDADGNALGALLEGSATNLATNSSAPASWTVAGATIEASEVDAPDGTTTFGSVVENSSTSTHFPSVSITATTGETYTFSVYIQPATRNLELRTAGIFNAYAGIFDPTSKTWLTAGSGSQFQERGFETYPDGSIRVWVTLLTDATGSLQFRAALATASTDSYTGDGASGLYMWGMQAEIGTLSSYISTGSSTATRAADVETISPSDQTTSMDWYARYDDDSTDKIASAVTGDFEVDPADLTRPNVKLIWAEAAA